MIGHKGKDTLKQIVGSMFGVSPHAIDVNDGYITIRMWEESVWAKEIANKIGEGATLNEYYVNPKDDGYYYSTIYHITFPVGRLFG